MAPRGGLGIVLSGASALGAYQVGVLRYLVEQVGAALDRPIGFEVVTGTSAGAIHASALASSADDLRAGIARLRGEWTSLHLDQMLRPSAVELISMLTDVVGTRCLRGAMAERARGGLLSPVVLEGLCSKAVQPDRIADNLRRRRLRGIAVAATRVSNGRAVVFHQGEAIPGRADPGMVDVVLSPAHVLASAAIPLLFPAVTIDGEAYCDGGLRQLVPLAPALRMGVDRLLVVSSVPAADANLPATTAGRVSSPAASSPLYLAGKALHALFAEGIAGDLERVALINRIYAAGRRRYGDGFATEMEAELGGAEPSIRPVEVLHLEPSRDVGVLAADYVAAPGFTRRIAGTAARALRWISDGDPDRAGDVLSYLLFDGGFAAALIDLGYADAAARHDDLVGLFAREPSPAAAAGGT